MGVINLTDGEKHALKAIDESKLDKLIDEAIRGGHSGALSNLALSSCGLYVSGALRRFDDALAKYGASKSAKKRHETETRARRAGNDLSSAIEFMKRRMAVEEQEGQLFYVDDNVFTPYGFSKDLVVSISYRWRRAVDDRWIFGIIAFHHTVDPRVKPRPKRKPSAAKQAWDLEAELYRTWEHLRDTALCTLKDYFRNGGDGSKIPEKFQARIDSHARELNNFSAEFWHEST